MSIIHLPSCLGRRSSVSKAWRPFQSKRGRSGGDCAEMRKSGTSRHLERIDPDTRNQHLTGVRARPAGRSQPTRHDGPIGQGDSARNEAAARAGLGPVRNRARVRPLTRHTHRPSQPHVPAHPCRHDALPAPSAWTAAQIRQRTDSVVRPRAASKVELRAAPALSQSRGVGVTALAADRPPAQALGDRVGPETDPKPSVFDLSARRADLVQ
jgi:hypothetical protein